MFGGLARKFFGSPNDRAISALKKPVQAIAALEPQMQALSDEDLRAKTEEFKQRLEAGETLDQLLTEAFATVRETARRVLGQRHFDVQLMGGMVLHSGKIAEMKTGEGKTLVSTLPVYLNALTGKGVHVVTVNDYLASRDAAWMGEIYRFHGMTVGVISNGMSDAERREAYACDVTYGTNNEFGFDYLRDNMKFRLEDMVHRPFHFAIVDEVDSILIDEARTPLIISGPAEDSSQLYGAVNHVIPELTDDDYEKDEKTRSIMLTESGVERIEEVLTERGLMESGGLYDAQNISLLHHVNQALRAHKMYERDTDYIVKDDKVVLIDQFTGRMMEGRRLSEGLHQAIEAKEGVTIQRENQTLASITFQNFFRLYPKLAGMTGTAMTEAGEFAEIYSLEVVEIPTNAEVRRVDFHDEVYRTTDEKYNAVVDAIVDARERNQPVLVGTVSIEKSEKVANLLEKRKIPHNVLNARFHDQEAMIIAQAGRPGAVTIATNMAGRGTDIQLGGNVEMRCSQEIADTADEAERQRRRQEITDDVERAREQVKDAGGLLVIATERHESRRIDNQLRGRSGRQGDPGASRFYLSLEDDLMRIFGSERMDSMLQRLGLEEGEAIVHPWINKAIEKAQSKVEAHNFEIRKNLLKFDNVMNDQRKVIYEQRREIMESEDLSQTVKDMRDEVIEEMVQRYIPPKSYPEQWDTDGLHAEVRRLFNLDLPVQDWGREEGIAEDEIIERLTAAADSKMAEKAANYGPEVMRGVEKSLMLQILDQTWKDHLLNLDHLRQGISLRAYAQRDPLNEYRQEAFDLFQTMLAQLRESITSVLCRVELRNPEDQAALQSRRPDPSAMQESRTDPAMSAAVASTSGQHPGERSQTDDDRQGAGTRPQPIRSAMGQGDFDPAKPETWGKVSRNALCPCGSGKKYKHCHGAWAGGAPAATSPDAPAGEARQDQSSAATESASDLDADGTEANPQRENTGSADAPARRSAS